MSDALVGRQSICDGDLEVVGYELLYRSSRDVSPRDVDGDAATASVAINALVEIGLDRLVGDKRAFVNLTRNFIVGGHWRNLPPDRVYLEILESVPPDDDVMAALRSAKEMGYLLALDDVVYSPRVEPFLPLVDVVKVEVPALDRDGLARHIDLLARPGVTLLAEKVETHEDFELCRGLGYEWFQGFFFCRPNVVRERKLPTDRISLIRLLARMQDPDLDLHEARAIIERNVSLSYQMLRVVNSAMYALPVRIDSIQQTIVLLGLTRIRRYVALLLLSEINDKPRELMQMALVRGRTCETLARRCQTDPDSAFCVGLLSVIDALIDLPMNEALETIPLSKPLEAALLLRDGQLGTLLSAALFCEGEGSGGLADDLAPEDIVEAYFAAVEWARDVIAEFATVTGGATAPRH